MLMSLYLFLNYYSYYGLNPRISVQSLFNMIFFVVVKASVTNNNSFRIFPRLEYHSRRTIIIQFYIFPF